MIGHAACSRQAKALQPHIHQSAEFLCLASGSQKYCVGDREYVIKGNQVWWLIRISFTLLGRVLMDVMRISGFG